MNNNIVSKRSELLFLYDIKDANPNGDPTEENKPRIDEETGQNIVTDVRLKRTIRDYLMNFKGYNGDTDKDKDIFIRKILDNEGNIQDAKMRANDFLGVKSENFSEKLKNIKSNVLKKCIDVRLFGATIPIEIDDKTSSITLTGPVQFKMGRSLNKVELKYIKGTGAFASGKGQQQKTFREDWVVNYSLICFYGIINENTAKETQLTEDDIKLLLDGIWNGTKNLISRSKVGQMPRLLLKINYKEQNYHIGDLDKLIKYNTEKDEEQIRDISEITIDVTELVNSLIAYKDKIESVEYKVDERVKISKDGQEKTLDKILSEAELPATPLLI
ncbi:MAG: type I-B CRISPR-associated protein Cas7/Csh2 [Thermoplasmata archaeon]